MAKSYKDIAIKYAKDAEKANVGAEIKMACKRFLTDLKRKDLEIHEKEPDFVIGIIEKIMVHKQGEDITGKSLVNEPMILLPWQIFTENPPV